MVETGKAAATSVGVAYTIAVVDSGGHLLAFARQDGALVGSIELAINKAATARISDKSMSLLAELAQPGAPLFDIQATNGFEPARRAVFEELPRRPGVGALQEFASRGRTGDLESRCSLRSMGS
jgi:hypothetical protein